MAKLRKEIKTLAEFLGYGMAQLHEHTALFHRTAQPDENQLQYKTGYLDAVQRVCQALTDLYGPDKIEAFRDLILAEQKIFHFEPLDEREMKTLEWLSEHGYDGELLMYRVNGNMHGITHLDAVHAYIGNDSEELEASAWQLRPLSKAQALQWYENVQNDKHAFLTCNGSTGLAEKLNNVLYSIELKYYQ